LRWGEAAKSTALRRPVEGVAAGKKEGRHEGVLRKTTLAEWTGLEPATSGVTGQHSNQLNYHSAEPGMIQSDAGRRNRERK
jgi:hypothetical protein